MTTREQRLRDDDGFPAFPVNPKAHECSDAEYMALRGMSLRDYFAAKIASAMVSTITDDAGYTRLRDLGSSHGLGLSEWIASESYKQADAMLKARKEPGQ
ncbi:hypothetical protein CH75_06245 [Dyella jiangningensis]|nr:hypothetical protein CH75_06245 [Dyella jiangningensis]